LQAARPALTGTTRAEGERVNWGAQTNERNSLASLQAKMFEVGKYYTIKMWEAGEDGGVINEYADAKFIEVALPLVKLKGSAFTGSVETIINTASIAFVSAMGAQPR
jgi:hypothetical protein